MDPITLSRLSRIRQQEILEWAANDLDEGSAVGELLWKFGTSIIAAGRKLAQAVNAARAAQTAPLSATELCECECWQAKPCAE